ncbi:MAG: 5'-methylthioadenosine/S-adenosylhomocysteine nucleosidase [Pseudomonadota bacterium]
MAKVKTVAGKRLLYVMAADAEYGPHLKKRFTPLICHVGPVEAAINVARGLIHHDPVDLVVSLGSAGSRVLEQAGVYQVNSVSYRDMDASALGFPVGVTPFIDVPATVAMPISVPGLAPASISTGANIVSDQAYNAIAADMVDMETWAIMRACMGQDVPMIGLRGISDGAEPLAELSDWTRYLEVIDERLAVAVDQLEIALEKGMISV